MVCDFYTFWQKKLSTGCSRSGRCVRKDPAWSCFPESSARSRCSTRRYMEMKRDLTGRRRKKLSLARFKNYTFLLEGLVQTWEAVGEWGWTARNAIAWQSFARHFWQQINCSTQILSFAQIQLILAKPDSSKWQKNDNCLTVSSSWHSFLLRQ